MLHGINATHNTKDYFTLKNMVEKTKGDSKAKGGSKYKKNSKEMNSLLLYIKDRVKKEKDEEAK